MHQCGQRAGIVAMAALITGLSAAATLAGIHIAGRITTR